MYVQLSFPVVNWNLYPLPMLTFIKAFEILTLTDYFLCNGHISQEKLVALHNEYTYFEGFLYNTNF